MLFRTSYASLANICISNAIVDQSGVNMPDYHDNPSVFPDDEELDVDIFEFDRKLKEIVSKIDTTMRKINEQYPEQSENEPADDAI